MTDTIKKSFAKKITMSVFAGMLATSMLSGCSAIKEMDQALSRLRKSSGDYEADKAMVALIRGDVDEAEFNVRRSLIDNPKNPYALLTGAIIYENTGRPQRARQMYEDILSYHPTTLTLLGHMKDITPMSVSDVAEERLEVMELQENKIVWPEKNKSPIFYNSDENVNETPASNNNWSDISTLKKAPRPIDGTAELKPFSPEDMNIISRFETFRRLYEEGLITRDEYQLRRNTNIGGLLPYSKPASAAGLNRSVPAPEMIVSRLKSLKRAFEMRTITAREHAAERTMILDALLPVAPAVKATLPPPPEGILKAAELVRRLESLQSMGLISSSEVDQERKAIEKLVKRGIVTEEMPANANHMNGKQNGPTMLVPNVTTPSVMKSEAPKATGNMGLHIASFQSEVRAKRGRDKLMSRFEKMIGKYPSKVSRVDLGPGKGVFYRVKVGPVGDRFDAVKLCKQLKRRGQYCVPSFMN